MYDLITIGGGAAGFFGTIHAAELGLGPCLILEKSKQLLGKVKISGGGRCNVTHHCFEARDLVKHYPRGEKSLIGPFSRFGPTDTIEWFAERGVELKTEPDGRMFPVTDDSQTVINCLNDAARAAGVEIRSGCGVSRIKTLDPEENQGARFCLMTEDGSTLLSRRVLIATGGTRLAAGARLVESLGHSLLANVPSLFTFKIDHPLIEALPGLSVEHTELQIPGSQLRSQGPTLITHWGLSGPGILKLSAWGARELAERNYQFEVEINWLPATDPMTHFQEMRQQHGKRRLHSRSLFPQIPKRLWTRFLEQAGIPEDSTWSQVSKAQLKSLNHWLVRCRLPVDGKSLNKDEFVTAGGVELKEINLKRMESKLHPGLHFAGEVMNVDGITGGFNFQNAWTSGYLAAEAMVD